jgi:hypothetical protein
VTYPSDSHWEYPIGAALPGRSWNIPGATSATALDLTGFTAKLQFAHPNRPRTVLVEWVTDFTYDDAFPNLVLAGFISATPPWQAIVTAWGRALPELGAIFLWYLHLTRTADSKPWPYGGEFADQGTVLILPELTAPA